jgi:hypothetical protein
MIRHCPRCRADYRPEISVCAHCDIPLVERQEEHDPRFDPPPAFGPVPAASDTPPGRYESLYFSYEVPDLLPLADRLTRQGIPFRVETTEEAHGVRLPRARYDLTVRDEEREVALGELEEFLGTEDDGTAGAGSGAPDGTAGGACPACGDPIGEADLECAGCGLALGGAEPSP